MKHIVNSTSHSGPASGLPVPAQTSELVPALVARVYEEAPPALRGRLLEQLLRPLGLLSLAAVANGIFAKITLGNGWYQLKVNGDDASLVAPGDVMALVSHVQQVSTQAVDGLSSIITTSPVLAGSATAAMLLALLAKQATSRPTAASPDDFDAPA